MRPQDLIKAQIRKTMDAEEERQRAWEEARDKRAIDKAYISKLHSVYKQHFEFEEHGFDKVHVYFILHDGYLYGLNEYSFEDAEHEVNGWKVETIEPGSIVASGHKRGNAPFVRLDDEKGVEEWLAFRDRIQSKTVEFVPYSRDKDPNALDEKQFVEFLASLGLAVVDALAIH